MLSESEFLELQTLLELQAINNKKDSLLFVDENTTKNYAFLKQSYDNQVFINEGLKEGCYKGIILEGGARSAKTWSVLFFIIYICLYKETGATINIVRETYNEFKTTLYLDFKKILPMFGLPNPFETVKDIQSFKINGNQINFIGADQPKKVHGATSDYLYFNEMLPIDKKIFDNLIMRCSKFWIGDFNPSVTEHWVFDKVITRPDVGHLRTNFKDNPKCPVGQKIEIMGYEPYIPGSYDVINDTLFYKGKPIDEKNQPPPHHTNVTSGTADLFNWKVYGLGLRGAMQGVIFQNIRYIDEFPKELACIYGNDFGFTSDPNAFGKYAETDTDIFVELLIYEPIETPQELAEYYQALGVEHDAIIACDSSDKYTGENKGTVEMVIGLQNEGYEEAFKIMKNKSVIYWLLSMKKKRINIVKNNLVHHAKKEAENYRFKEVHGILINMPIDKWNHFWDMTRYCHMAWNDQQDHEEWN